MAFAVIAQQKLLVPHQVVGGGEGPLCVAQLRPEAPVSLAAGCDLDPFLSSLCSCLRLEREQPLSCPTPPATYPRLTSPMPALPPASTPHATSFVRRECTIWDFAEGHPAPSAMSAGGEHLLDRGLQVQRGDGRRVGAAWARAAPCRAPHHAASSLQELKGDCGIERRRGGKKIKKNHEISKQLGLKPRQRCSGCLPAMCGGEEGRLPLLKALPAQRGCAGALVPGEGCLRCVGSRDGGVRSAWMRLGVSPLSALGNPAVGLGGRRGG